MATDLELKAPKGKYRVVGVDTFDGTDWVEGDYLSVHTAEYIVTSKGGNMTKMYAYDDEGKLIFESGTF